MLADGESVARSQRHGLGALDADTVETRAVCAAVDDGRLVVISIDVDLQVVT